MGFSAWVGGGVADARLQEAVGLIFEGRESRGERERLKTGNANNWDEPKNLQCITSITALCLSILSLNCLKLFLK